jgi:hypothetical protein
VVAEVELQAEGGGEGFEDSAAGGNDFTADAIAGDEACEVCVRTGIGSIGKAKVLYEYWKHRVEIGGIITYPKCACGHFEAVMRAQELSRNGNFGVAACAEDRMVGALCV